MTTPDPPVDSPAVSPSCRLKSPGRPAGGSAACTLSEAIPRRCCLLLEMLGTNGWELSVYANGIPLTTVLNMGLVIENRDSHRI